MNSGIKIYKLTYSGKAKRLPNDNLLNNFTLFDVLLFYLPSQKRIYIWIGKKASQNLKNHIPKVREILADYEPNLIILRTITVESGFETADFLELLQITNKELSRRIAKLETNLLPSLSEINKLKEKADNAFISENFENVIKFAERIKEIAEQINDNTLEQDQIDLIEEASSRSTKSELISQIESEAKKVLDEFNQLIKMEYHQEAHKMVKDFKLKFEAQYNLSSIPKAQQLLLKDENMIYSLKVKEKEIKENLDDVERQFNKALIERNLYDAKNLLSSAKKETIKIIDENVISKWIKNEEKLLKLQEEKLEEIFHLNNAAIEQIDKGNLEDALKRFEVIIKELKNFY
ncbi:MAG: hypothetical protein EAX89_10615 [Candidatus Lokiarchaeota archaeon]|nr:hypothetical protein [Candidatus Lokiarchaeota archaeon]